jgi:hypothetical protein
MKPTVFSTGFVSQAVLLFLTFCLFQSCNTTESPPNGELPLTFSAIDASCTEIWLAVKLAAGAQPRTLTLQRDTQTILTTTLTASDTLIVDEGLLPNREYTYTLTRPNGILTDRLMATITTMDTTSHDWVFDPPVLLGDGSSSVLYDVAIINDTLAYAVGEIFHQDSSQNWTLFNLAKWNGMEWTLHRLHYQGNIQHLRWILAFNENDIWVNPILRWDGVQWQQLPFDPIFSGVTTTKAWGTSSSDFYVVGNNGFIAHYSTGPSGAGTWRRVESGTGLPIMGIHGARKENGGYEILAVASDVFTNQGKRLLRLEGMSANAVNDSGLSWNLTSLWFHPGRRYYVVGAGVHHKRTLNGNLWTVYPPGVVTTYHSSAVSGNALNNVFVVGSFLEMVHFNGVSWRHYRGEVSGSGALGGVAVGGNLVIAVGYTTEGAIAVVGRR